MRVVVGLGVLEEDAELPAEAALGGLAVVEEGVGFVGEVGALGGGEGALVEALGRGDPGGFADEGC